MKRIKMFIIKTTYIDNMSPNMFNCMYTQKTYGYAQKNICKYVQQSIDNSIPKLV